MDKCERAEGDGVIEADGSRTCCACESLNVQAANTIYGDTQEVQDRRREGETMLGGRGQKERGRECWEEPAKTRGGRHTDHASLRQPLGGCEGALFTQHDDIPVGW